MFVANFPIGKRGSPADNEAEDEREDQVRVADRVVRVEMGDERDPKLHGFERLDACVEKCRISAPDDARAEVD